MWPLSNGRADKEPNLIHLYKPGAYNRFLFCLQIKGWEDLTISRVWVKRKMSKSQLHQVHLLLLLSFQSCPTLWDPIEGSPLGFSRQEHWSRLPFPSPMHESEKWKWSRSVVSDSSWPHELQLTRPLHPWDFPGKSTGVGCHCLLRKFICKVQTMRSKSIAPL